MFLNWEKNNILNNLVIKRKIIQLLLRKSIFILVLMLTLKHEKWFKFNNLNTIINWLIDWIIFIESFTFCICWWWWKKKQTSSLDIAKTWRKKKSIVKISFSRFRTNFLVFFLSSIKSAENAALIENTTSAISNFFKRMRFIEHSINCEYNSKFKYLLKKHVMILCLKKQFSQISCCFLLIMQKANTNSNLSKSLLKHRVQTCFVERSTICSTLIYRWFSYWLTFICIAKIYNFCEWIIFTLNRFWTIKTTSLKTPMMKKKIERKKLKKRSRNLNCK